MTPYYDDGQVVIYHGDCLEILDGVGAVDHAMFDPPYSEHVHSKSMRGADGGKGPISASRDLGFASLTAGTLAAVSAWCGRFVDHWLLAFSDTESAHLWREAFEAARLEYVRTCFWHKVGGAPQFTGDRPAVACEAITVCHPSGRKRWNGGGKQGLYSVPIVLDRGASATEWRCHTTQKPEALMVQLVADFTQPGDRVIDPFMGSGTTLVACKRLGRKAIGIEREEKYCEVAAKRLQQGSLLELATRSVQDALPMEAR